jgi:hypothetical protein
LLKRTKQNYKHGLQIRAIYCELAKGKRTKEDLAAFEIQLAIIHVPRTAYRMPQAEYSPVNTIGFYLFYQ